ncbi:hypothetical protein ABMA27_016036 [Loxostege sticticalis]|uniref:Homeobox domain-containing protein n=1 Tax=Loxostege sticticalis TaxID=481309 RepID=A0ABR3I5B4_LOXSC
MVNYVNPLAMYQGKSGQYGGGWYGWQHQNFEEQQWCAWNGAPAGGEWAPDPHHFPKREPGDREITDIPSPARGDLASPGEGSPGSRPAQPPAPPRSPYEWMKKPNYQTQPNPDSLLQVKIWFQNRRAKERKQVKKREEVVMKEKGDHASLQHAQLHHATMLHHQQMMNGMMHHHHYHQGVLQGVPEPLVPGVPPVPLL